MKDLLFECAKQFSQKTDVMQTLKDSHATLPSLFVYTPVTKRQQFKPQMHRPTISGSLEGDLSLLDSPTIIIGSRPFSPDFSDSKTGILLQLSSLITYKYTGTLSYSAGLCGVHYLHPRSGSPSSHQHHHCYILSEQAGKHKATSVVPESDQLMKLMYKEQ